MSTWLKLLPLELEGIDQSDITEPDYALEEADHLVGEMSDMSRRLFTLGRLLEKEAKQHHLDAQFCNDPKKKAELEAKTHELVDKSNAVKGIMWIGIRDEFEIWSGSVGVRVGFKVVTSPSPDQNIPPIIRGLLNL